MSSDGRWQRRIQAAESALRLLDEIGVDQTEQIDVFGICQELDLWLAFLPMANLLGAFIPEGVGGVLVTSRRSIPIQRYTAAHEIGHWRLDHGHGIALDGQEQILGRTAVEREQLAQIFAGSFLMPPPLVFQVLGRLGVEGDSLEPEHAYAVSREAGVSYEAAIRQLNHLEVISNQQATVLMRHHPIRVKADLALGRRPVNPYADVWPVDEQWDDQVLALRVEDEVVISLPENRTTGYRWMLPAESRHEHPEPAVLGPIAEPPAPPNPEALVELRRQFENASTQQRRVPSAVTTRRRSHEARPAAHLPALIGDAEVVGDDYVPARSRWLSPRAVRRARLAAHAQSAGTAPARTDQESPLVGGSGRRLLGVRFARPGETTLRLEYRSPYTSDDPVEQYVLHARVEPRHVGFSVEQLATRSGEAWTAQVRQRQLEQPLPPLDEDDLS